MTTNDEKQSTTQNEEASTQVPPILDRKRWVSEDKYNRHVFSEGDYRFTVYDRVKRSKDGSYPIEWEFELKRIGVLKPLVRQSYDLDAYRSIQEFLEGEKDRLLYHWERVKASAADKEKAQKSGDHLEHEDDVELARYLQRKKLEGVVYAEGAFWRYGETHWETVPEHELNQAVQELSGLTYGDEDRKVRMSKTRAISVLWCLANNLAQPDFFAQPSWGINAADCFIAFHEDGSLDYRPHAKEHRQRDTSKASAPKAGMLGELPEGSLLHTLLGGITKDDPQAREKIWFLQQIAFVALSGFGTQLKKQKAVTFLGKSAENGKNQILDLFTTLLPKTAVSAVPPHEFSDDNKLLCLVGAKLNITGEMSANAIAGERFKSIITGDLVTGRKAYAGEPTTFRPQALHLFAANGLPAFKGGFDKGVKRRLAVLEFNRVIPEGERIAWIGQRVGTEEADLLLAWALGAAQHILTEKMFDEPPCSKDLVEEWTQTDPVNAWWADRVMPADAPTLPEAADKPQRILSNEMYKDFECYSYGEEGKKPNLGQRAFNQRVQTLLRSGQRYIAGTGGFRGFEGVRLYDPTDAMKRSPCYQWPEGSCGDMGNRTRYN